MRLTLWQAMAGADRGGDTFVVTAGCDKRFDTCRDRFDNAVNFRGFPHIPGNDFVVATMPGGLARAAARGEQTARRTPATQLNMVDHDRQRHRRARRARWIGTPYRHQASLQGVGCDCLGLVRGVWRALVGDEPEQAPPYAPDWAEAARETLADGGAPASHRRSRSTTSRPATCCCFAGAPALPPSMPRSSTAPARWCMPMTAPRSRVAHRAVVAAAACLAFRFPELIG